MYAMQDHLSRVAQSKSYTTGVEASDERHPFLPKVTDKVRRAFRPRPLARDRSTSFLGKRYGPYLYTGPGIYDCPREDLDYTMLAQRNSVDPGRRSSTTVQSRVLERQSTIATFLGDDGNFFNRNDNEPAAITYARSLQEIAREKTTTHPMSSILSNNTKSHVGTPLYSEKNANDLPSNTNLHVQRTQDVGKNQEKEPSQAKPPVLMQPQPTSGPRKREQTMANSTSLKRKLKPMLSLIDLNVDRPCNQPQPQPKRKKLSHPRTAAPSTSIGATASATPISKSNINDLRRSLTPLPTDSRESTPEYVPSPSPAPVRHEKKIRYNAGKFSCPHDGCFKVCKSAGDLRRHLESLAHKERSYKCLACNTAFTRIDPLRRHLRNKSRCLEIHNRQERAVAAST